MRKFGEIVDIPALTSTAPAKRTFKGRFKIEKSADDKMLAFGWASVAVRSTGEQIEDWQEDMIDPDDLEKAAYEFAELYREGGEMHERGGAAILIESVVFIAAYTFLFIFWIVVTEACVQCRDYFFLPLIFLCCHKIQSLLS